MRFLRFSKVIERQKCAVYGGCRRRQLVARLGDDGLGGLLFVCEAVMFMVRM